MAAAPELSAPILEILKSYSMNISMFPFDVSVTMNNTYKIFFCSMKTLRNKKRKVQDDIHLLEMLCYQLPCGIPVIGYKTCV